LKKAPGRPRFWHGRFWRMLWAEIQFEIVRSPACPRWLLPATRPVIAGRSVPYEKYEIPGAGEDTDEASLYTAEPACIPTGDGKFPTVIEQWGDDKIPKKWYQ